MMTIRLAGCNAARWVPPGWWAAFVIAAALVCPPAATAAADDQPGAFIADGPLLPACSAPQAQKIHQAAFLRVGGVEQWITIQGDSCANPVVLFVHGGPGNPMSPYADAVYGAWEKDFTLVQWDQRGAGMSYGRNPPAADAVLTIEQMAADGVAVAEFLTRHLGKPKVILMASSWGSVLGVHMAKLRPDLFQAYVGTAQLVSQQANQAAFYARTLALAEAAGDQKTVAALTPLGPPPWRNPRAFGVVRRASRIYEAKVTTAAPPAWWQPAPLYASKKALDDSEQGEDYSWLQFVGLRNDGMSAQVDLPKLGTRFALPVFILQGSEDLLTPLAVTKPYFDSIQAPEKALVMVPMAGHDPNQAMVDAQYRVLRERVARR